MVQVLPGNVGASVELAEGIAKIRRPLLAAGHLRKLVADFNAFLMSRQNG